MNTNLLTLISIALLFYANTSNADQIRIAVASNFMTTMKSIVEDFQTKTDHKVVVSYGSTGKHFAQITHGAPIDIFFSADHRSPERLEKNGLAIANSRFTYAIGKIVLWSPMENYVDPNGAVLKVGNFKHLAIANPKLAPYGKAAQQVLKAKGLWHTIRRQLVQGENIAQTFQLVISGNAALGFIAQSQWHKLLPTQQGSSWKVPQHLYQPIAQQAILLQESTAARAFMAFVQQPASHAIIRAHGYEIP